MDYPIETMSNQRTAMMTNRTVSILSEEYACRGIAMSAKRLTEKQEAEERKFFCCLPEAYRKSEMTEEEIEINCRHGKSHMDARDLIEYIEESRRMRIQKSRNCSAVVINEIADIYKRTACPSGVKIKRLTGRVHPFSNVQNNGFYEMDSEKSTLITKKNEKHHFPFSIFASAASVVIALMLILSGSVMVKNAERRVQNLKSESLELSAEVNELKSAFATENNLEKLQEIALRQCENDDGSFLRTDSQSLDGAKEVQRFETKENSNIGLSALLSAFGIRK